MGLLTFKCKREGMKDIMYVELRVAGGVPLLVQGIFKEKMIRGLKWSCEKRGLRIYEYTILPDRIVMIVNNAWGSTVDTLESFKNFSSKAVMMILRNGNSNLKTSWMISAFQDFGPKNRNDGIHIWEEELFTKRLFKQADIDNTAMEIHQKAVKLKLVENPENYLLSSASPSNPLAGWIVEATDRWT